MSMLSKIEKIEREIFKHGKFTLKSTVLTGRKGANNNKLDAVYNRSYNSQKYVDRSELTTTSISTSDFLVFAYNNFEAKVNEEIYASFPNIMDIKFFCSQLLAMVTSNEAFQKDNTVSIKYKDASIESQPLGAGKVLVAIPTSIQKDQNLLRGAYLFFNGEDKYIEMDVKSIFTLNEIVKSIDLLTLSNSTLMLGMMANMSSSGDEEAFSPTTKNTLPPRNSFFSKRNNFTGKQESNGTTVDTTSVQESSNPFAKAVNQPTPSKFTKPTETAQATGLQPRTTTGFKKPTKVETSSPVTGENLMSMSNILAEADKISYEPEQINPNVIDEELIVF